MTGNRVFNHSNDSSSPAMTYTASGFTDWIADAYSSSDWLRPLSCSPALLVPRINTAAIFLAPKYCSIYCLTASLIAGRTVSLFHRQLHLNRQAIPLWYKWPAFL